MKRFIRFASIAALALTLVGCNWLGSIFNPIIGSWETTIVGVSVSKVFNADATFTDNNSLGEVGVTKSGTWTSTAAVITETWPDDSEVQYTYSFNSDKTQMTLQNVSSLIAITYTKQ